MSIGFVALERSMASLDVDGDLIRKLRTERGWPQEQLAEVAGISYRTVQRIEVSGKASFESLRAIACAFNLGVNDLLKKRRNTETPVKPPHTPSFLMRVTSGRALFDYIEGAHAGRFDHDELRSQEEVDLVASFLQDMRDYLDIWDEMEQSHRVEATFAYSERIEELQGAGFWVFASQEKRPIRAGEQIIEDWRIVTILVARSDNPTIIRVPTDKESVATTRPDSEP